MQDIERDNCLKRAIATLKKALGERKSKPQYIATLSKRGYRFIAKVKMTEGYQPSGKKES